MIDPSRVVILSMFCSKSGYVHEKNAVEATWGQKAIKAGFKHIFYREALKDSELGLHGNVLCVKCGKNRQDTYDKTVLAMKYVEENLQYDVVVKTNVSTYVNIDILEQLLEYKESYGKNLIYGNRLRLLSQLMYVRGDFTVLDRPICQQMINNYEETKTVFPNGGSDDHLMFYLMYAKCGFDFCKQLMTIPSDCRVNYDYDIVKNLCAVRLKTLGSTSEPDVVYRMKNFHAKIIAEKRPFSFLPVFNKAKVKCKETPTSRETKIDRDQAIQIVLNNNHQIQSVPYGRVAVYTCITGGYDNLKSVRDQGKIFDFICFSDKVIPNASKLGWKIRPIPAELSHLSKVKQQRVVKICPHRYLPEYKASIWIDGSFEVKNDLYGVIALVDFAKTPIWTRHHPVRDCIYDEIKVCRDKGLVAKELCDQIESRYKSENYPCHHGLTETNILVRLHSDPKCQSLCEKWVDELVEWSHRDQLSFEYVCWKVGVSCGHLLMLQSLRSNRYVVQHKHVGKRPDFSKKKVDNHEHRVKEIPIPFC